MARDNLTIPQNRYFSKDYDPIQITRAIDQILQYLAKTREIGQISASKIYLNDNVFWTSGSGTPESVVIAPIGSLYTRTDGSTSTTLYVKESGTGNTGWVAK